MTASTETPRDRKNRLARERRARKKTEAAPEPAPEPTPEPAPEPAPKATKEEKAADRLARSAAAKDKRLASTIDEMPDAKANETIEPIALDDFDARVAREVPKMIKKLIKGLPRSATKRLRAVNAFHVGGKGRTRGLATGYVVETIDGVESIAIDSEGGARLAPLRAENGAFVTVEKIGLPYAIMEARRNDAENAWSTVVAIIIGLLSKKHQRAGLAILIKGGMTDILWAGWTKNRRLPKASVPDTIHKITKNDETGVRSYGPNAWYPPAMTKPRPAKAVRHTSFGFVFPTAEEAAAFEVKCNDEIPPAGEVLTSKDVKAHLAAQWMAGDAANAPQQTLLPTGSDA